MFYAYETNWRPAVLVDEASISSLRGTEMESHKQMERMLDKTSLIRG